jgi:hypothetical protein
MRRLILALGAGALCLALAPTLALGIQSNDAAAAAAGINTNAIVQGIAQSGGPAGGQAAGQQGTATQVLPIAVAPAVNAQVVPVNANVPIALGLSPLPIDPFAVLADPVGTVTGVLADPLGAVTGVLGGLPLPIAI